MDIKDIKDNLNKKIGIDFYDIRFTKAPYGKNDNKDIQFYTLSSYEDIYPGYKNLLVLFYKVDIDDITDNTLDYRIKERTKTESDIDIKTGNVHPSRNKIEEYNDGCVHQIVLANKTGHNGPYTNPMIDEKAIHEKLPNTPRASYYPMLDTYDDLTDKEKKKQAFLESIFDVIKEEITK